MKKINHIIIALVLASSLSSTTLFAGGNHDHGHGSHAHTEKHHKKKPGPNGGRVITKVEPRAEFFVTPDKKVQITFLNDDYQAIEPSEQKVTLIGGDRSNPTRIKFIEKDNTLISDQTLPDIKNMPVVLQIKTTPASKTVREKFYLNFSSCPTCDYEEYACICGH
ncbi:hypothetical protein [Rubellicoccus peritrichatus]|uniref:Uncharacterized protein n=1 Tax=Rubellicoccus peritrichatus TaxID=3080537 RepID=A0AAQ3LFP6_9BACT|nr:hypothetical protein [Puniceicoccus sp. CR14]WOO42970.1 hypothetical protein RZN69_07680 [Puniceicoccus sp. CR14]